MRYIIKETQYKRLIEPAEEDAVASTDDSSGSLKAAGYGDISRVPGSEAENLTSVTAGTGSQGVILYTDKELKTRQGSYILKSMVNNNGKVEVDMGNFRMSTDCNRVPNDNSFDYGTKKYFSTELANMASEKCKTQ